MILSSVCINHFTRHPMEKRYLSGLYRTKSYISQDKLSIVKDGQKTSVLQAQRLLNQPMFTSKAAPTP